MGVRRGECHAAGTHLLDEATGGYNESYIERLFPSASSRATRLLTSSPSSQCTPTTDEVYEKPDFEGAKFVCSPPIRSEADKAALWGGIKAVSYTHLTCSGAGPR